MTASKDRTLRVWHTQTGRCIGVAEGHVEAVGAVAIAPRHGQFAVSGSKDL
jgi:U3 small nucleolar RNA-associated protein 13